MTAWTCVNCDIDVDEEFDACWQCGASPDGAADSSFVREVDVATLPPGWVQRIKCESCGYTGKVLIGHYGYRWWTVPLAIALSITLIGVIPWVILFLVIGNWVFKACPNCNARDHLIDWDGAVGEPSPESEDIWKAKQEADRRAFQKNKLKLMALTFGVLAIVLIYMFFLMRDM